MENSRPEELKKARRNRTPFTALVVLVLIPALILLGSRVWGDRKYYLVSFLVLVAAMLPLAARFERRRPQARELVVLSVMTALGVAGRAAFYMIPQFKPVAAIVIVTGAAFGADAGFMVGASTALLSNFFFGQGPWTPWQMLGFGLIGFFAGLLFAPGRLKPKRVPLCIYGGLSTLVLYGVTMDSASLFLFSSTITWQALATVYATGFVFNLIHGAATVVFLAVLSQPLLKKLGRVQRKFGLLEE